MITISNEYLTATFQELGAELKSLRMEGKEYIWPGDPEIWKGSCPLLFPICGGLKEDQYTYQGKEYHLPRHGVARTRTFRVESQRADQVVFLLGDRIYGYVHVATDGSEMIYETSQKNKHPCTHLQRPNDVHTNAFASCYPVAAPCSYTVIKDTFDGKYPSDHYPILAELRL